MTSNSLRISFLLCLSSLSALSLNHSLLVPEFKLWREDRYIDCIFCIDYDNFHRISIAGCDDPHPVTCKGNTCFMRQHKSKQFFLYTSGCLNLTKSEYKEIARLERDTETETGGTGAETLLCEVSRRTNTCLCSHRKCNNMTIPAPFSEYHSSSLFQLLDFRELLQFRYFVPNEPLLRRLDVSKLDHMLSFHVPGYLSSNSGFTSFFLVILAVLCNL